MTGITIYKIRYRQLLYCIREKAFCTQDHRKYDESLSIHAENALVDQQPPVTKIDLQALEESVID